MAQLTENVQRADRASQAAPSTGAVTLFARYRGAICQVLLDRPASDPKALFIRFDDGKRIEDVALCELKLVEARPR